MQGRYSPSHMFLVPAGVPGGSPQFGLLLRPSGQIETETISWMNTATSTVIRDALVPLNSGQRTHPEVDGRVLPQVPRVHVSSSPISPAHDRCFGDGLGRGATSALYLQDLSRFIPVLLHELAGASCCLFLFNTFFPFFRVAASNSSRTTPL